MPAHTFALAASLLILSLGAAAAQVSGAGRDAAGDGAGGTRSSGFSSARTSRPRDAQRSTRGAANSTASATPARRATEERRRERVEAMRGEQGGRTEPWKAEDSVAGETGDGAWVSQLRAGAPRAGLVATAS